MYIIKELIRILTDINIRNSQIFLLRKKKNPGLKVIVSRDILRSANDLSDIS